MWLSAGDARGAHTDVHPSLTWSEVLLEHTGQQIHTGAGTTLSKLRAKVGRRTAYDQLDSGLTTNCAHILHVLRMRRSPVYTRLRGWSRGVRPHFRP